MKEENRLLNNKKRVISLITEFYNSLLEPLMEAKFPLPEMCIDGDQIVIKWFNWDRSRVVSMEQIIQDFKGKNWLIGSTQTYSCTHNAGWQVKGTFSLQIFHKDKEEDLTLEQRLEFAEKHAE